MPDNAPAGSTAASPAPGSQGTNDPSQGSGAGSQPEYVSVEKFNEVQNRLQGLSATIGTLTNEIKNISRVKTQESPAPAGDAKPVVDDAVNQRLKQLEAQLEKQQKQAKDLSLRSALAAAGVSGSDIEDAKILFAARHNDSLVTDDTGNVERVGDTTLGEYIKHWLSGDGKRFMPTRSNPSTGGVPAGSAHPSNIPTVTKQALREGRVNMSDVASGKVRVVD